MKKSRLRAALPLFIGVVVAYAIVCLALVIFGPAYFSSTLSSAARAPVSIGSTSLSFPFTLVARDCSLGSMASARSIRVALNPLGLFAGKVVLQSVSLEGPVVRLGVGSDGTTDLGRVVRAARMPRIYLLGLRVRKGTMHVRMQGDSASPVDLEMRDVSLDVGQGVPWPFGSVVKCSLQAHGTGKTGIPQGKLSGRGWFDFAAKKGEGMVEAHGFDLSPWAGTFGSVFSGRKLAEGTGDFTAQLTGTPQGVAAECDLKLSGLRYEGGGAEEKGDPFSFMAALISQARMKFNLTYSFATKAFSTSNVKMVLGNP